MRISVVEAATRLDELCRLVDAGEEVVLTEDGRPVARLVLDEKWRAAQETRSKT